MIDDAVRRSFLRSFPATVAIAVLATRPTAYLLAARERSGVTVHAIDADGAGAGVFEAGATVIVDDLADLTDPAALLANVRAAVPHARLFALASNAAYAPTLARFTAGAPFPLARALVAAELPALFARANYATLACTPIAGPATNETFPHHVADAGVVFDVESPAVSERLRAAGYVVVADPR